MEIIQIIPGWTDSHLRKSIWKTQRASPSDVKDNMGNNGAVSHTPVWKGNIVADSKLPELF